MFSPDAARPSKRVYLGNLPPDVTGKHLPNTWKLGMSARFSLDCGVKWLLLNYLCIFFPFLMQRPIYAKQLTI